MMLSAAVPPGTPVNQNRFSSFLIYNKLSYAITRTTSFVRSAHSILAWIKWLFMPLSHSGSQPFTELKRTRFSTSSSSEAMTSGNN